MKRVLMLCFAYPPAGGVGMIRSWKFAKFLPEFGFAPTIVTPEAAPSRISVPDDRTALPGACIVRTRYTDVVSAWKTRLGLAHRSEASGTPPGETPPPGTAHGAGRAVRLAVYAVIATPDEHVGWLAPGLDAARRVLRSERHDVIYSTSPPETAHLLARRLKDEFGLPWVADLRDLWSRDHFRQRSAAKRRVLRWIERRTLGGADAVVTVSEPWRDVLARDYAAPGRPVVCVPHGFDADDYDPHAAPAPDVFRVVYTGSLDRDFQDPGPVMRAAGRLVRAGRIDPSRFAMDFHVFGDHQPDLAALARRHGIEACIRTRPTLGYLDTLRTQQRATVLLAIQWDSKAGEGNPPLKVYDYLGARRPILVAGSGVAVLGPLLADTGAGVVAPTDAEIERVLGAWYDEFSGTGRVGWPGREASLAAYSRRAQTSRLAAVLSAVLGRAA